VGVNEMMVAAWAGIAPTRTVVTPSTRANAVARAVIFCFGNLTDDPSFQGP
jgi:hypothetical protein